MAVTGAELSAHKNLPIPNESDYAPLFASEKFEDKVWNLNDIHCEDSSVKIEEVTLLVFDEARELLEKSGFVFGVNRFRLFRRALREYRATYPDSRLFAVMVDTSSRIQNFSPSLGADPSARRVAGEGGSHLFHPFVLRGSFDALFQDKKLPEDTKDLTCLLDSENYLYAGRPLVALQSGSKDQQNQFLLRKLNGGSYKITNNGALSTVLCRLATSISCQASAASDLVADHMVYLLAADKEREKLFISFLPEPRMAAAAASMWKIEHIFVEKLLPALQHAMISGLVSAGCRGEIVGQIILLKAFDAACEECNKPPGSCVSLLSVLTQLLPSCVSNPLMFLRHECIPDSLMTCRLACGQFVQLTHNFSLSTNVQLAERHCGAAFKAMQAGNDLMVPIITENPSAFLIQIKNLSNQDVSTPASLRCLAAMLPSFSLSGQKINTTDLEALDHRCFRLYLQLGGSRRSYNKTPGCLEIFGIESRCLSEPVKRFLQSFSDVSKDLESFILAQTDPQDSDSAQAAPYPDTLQEFRQTIPFVIDKNPEWNDMTVKELRRELKARGGTPSNKCKAQLVSELQKYSKHPVPKITATSK